jgi:hypothetical protein
MAVLPAFCDKCLLVFPGMPVPSGKNIASIGNTAKCPRCGGAARVLEGLMNIAGNTIEILGGTNATAVQLAALQALLEHGLVTAQKPEEVAAAVERAGFGELAKQLLIPKTSGDFYAAVAVILTAIGLIKDSGSATQANHSVTMNQVMEQVYRAPEPRSTSKKIGRNERCICGSGKRYKHCCGSVR